MREQHSKEQIQRQMQVFAAWYRHRTAAGVARELDVSWDTARLWLDALGLRRNHTGRKQRLVARRRERRIWQNASWMRTAYAHLGTVERVAERAGCCKGTASMWLARHGVEVCKRVMRGGAHYAAKLTEDQVREIRRRYEADKTRACRERLATEMEVSVPTICKVVFRQSWKHVK